MRSKIMTQLKDEELAAFRRLDPVERILAMERVLYELLGARAAEEGVTDGEVYQRYLAHRQGRHRPV